MNRLQHLVPELLSLYFRPKRSSVTFDTPSDALTLSYYLPYIIYITSLIKEVVPH